MADKQNDRLFPNLDADEAENSVTVIQSACLNCHAQGETRLLLTRIPFFKDIILASFSCPSCGFANRSVDTAGMIEDQGVRFELRVRNEKDLSRQIVATEVSEMRLPELDSSFPISQGKLTTVEGTIREVMENIRDTMNAYRQENPELAGKLAEFIGKLAELLNGETQFDWVLDDPRGSAFVENPFAPELDQFLKIVRYERSAEQNQKLGLTAPEDTGEGVTEESKPDEQPEEEKFDMKNEVVEIPVNCPNCSAPTMNRMKMVDIPYFKQVLLMAVNCEACGFRDNEIKPGAGIADKARKLTLHVTDVSDLSRDLLKSETCCLSIPEFELESVSVSLGGKFTTVEGILVVMRDQLKNTNPFSFGDSAHAESGGLGVKLKELVAKLDKAISGELLDYHIVMDDSAGNSYIQNLYAPDPDPELKIEDYERTEEQNDELGIDTMNA